MMRPQMLHYRESRISFGITLNMKKIKLTQGKYTLVDNKDFESVSKFKWCYNGGYAMRGIREGKHTRKVYMHRFICNPEYNLEIDHINRDRLDNRRINLRACTRKENAGNISLAKNNTSGFKGVGWSMEKNKWRSYIETRGKLKHLGYFNNKKVAAKIYNKVAKLYFGKFASLNIIKI